MIILVQRWVKDFEGGRLPGGDNGVAIIEDSENERGFGGDLYVAVVWAADYN
jgi:hypothetical protein